MLYNACMLPRFQFFDWVCGVQFRYGNEELMQLAPSGIVFATYALSQLVYALPVALINAELAVAIPEDGGWVLRRAVASYFSVSWFRLPSVVGSYLTQSGARHNYSTPLA
jgi:hypothetical protein